MVIGNPEKIIINWNMFSDLLNTDDRANVVDVVIVTRDEKEVFEDDVFITFDFENDDVSIFDF